MYVPSWLVKALAWAFIAGLVSWGGYLHAQTDKLREKNTEQDVKLKEVDTAYEQNLVWIRESLVRIEAEVKENK